MREFFYSLCMSATDLILPAHGAPVISVCCSFQIELLRCRIPNRVHNFRQVCCCMRRYRMAEPEKTTAQLRAELAALRQRHTHLEATMARWQWLEDTVRFPTFLRELATAQQRCHDLFHFVPAGYLGPDGAGPGDVSRQHPTPRRAQFGAACPGRHAEWRHSDAGRPGHGHACAAPGAGYGQRHSSHRTGTDF